MLARLEEAVPFSDSRRVTGDKDERARASSRQSLFCCITLQCNFFPFLLTLPRPSALSSDLRSLLLPLCDPNCHSESLSSISFPFSPWWGWHLQIWWTSEALILAGGFRGRPHMNGLVGRGGATSKELRGKPVGSGQRWVSAPACWDRDVMEAEPRVENLYSDDVQ